MSLRGPPAVDQVGNEMAAAIRKRNLRRKDQLRDKINKLTTKLGAKLAHNRELKADISYEDERSLNRLTARNTVSTTQEETTSSRRLNLSRQTWTDRANYFRLLSGGFESNDELGLDRRFTIGAGIGRYFIDTQRSTLSGNVSLRAMEEFGEDGENTESLETEFAVDYGVWRFDSPDLDLRYNLSLFPSLTESGRLRGETELRLRWEIYRDLFWDVSAWGSFDNQALDENADRATDWGLTTGVGWEF